MNPNSSYYLSFDTGFPNAVDRANGRSGRYLMVHGTCSSAGCFAMTDATIAEIYAIAREAFIGGQRSFQFQSYPFRMTAENMAKFRNDPNIGFWQNLKEGSDYFEALREEPKVGQCGTKYVFGGADAAAGACKPKVEPAVAEKRERDARGRRTRGQGHAGGAGRLPGWRPEPGLPAAGQHQRLREPRRHRDGAALRRQGIQPAQSRRREPPGDPGGRSAGDRGRPEGFARDDGRRRAARPRESREGGRREGPAKPASTTLMANRVEPDARVDTTAALAEKPARVAVADADGDPSAYQKLFGKLFAKDNPAKDNPAPATPAAEAAVVPEPVKLAHAASTVSPKPAAKAHAVKTAKVEARAEAKPTLRKGEAEGKAKP
ncbi:L,D-transpeptidase family protein [Methylobacterium oryzae CBMB20]